jgi:hypothetical protein
MTDDERWAVFVEYAADNKFSAKSAEFETREEFKEAMDALSRVTQDDRDRAYYISRLKYEMDTAQAEHDWREAGLHEGIQIGTEKGIQIGTVKGIEIGKIDANIETVQRSILLGLPAETIEKLTGLPMSKIEEIKEKLWKQNQE